MAFPDSTWPFIKLMGTGCHITTFSGRGPRHPFRKALWGPPALQHTLCGVCHPENMGNWGSTWTQQLKHLHRLERNLYHNFRQEINAEVWKNVGFCVRVGELCLKKNKQTNKIPQKKPTKTTQKTPTLRFKLAPEGRWICYLLWLRALAGWTSAGVGWKSTIDFTSQGDACETLTTNINIKVPREEKGTASCFVSRMKKCGKRDLAKLCKTASALP